MHQRLEWELVFQCPSCNRASRVRIAAMHSLLRCPHCRKTAAIDKRGIAKASVHAALSGGTAEAKPAAPARPRKCPTINSWPALGLMAIVLLPILALSLWPALRLRSSVGSDVESQRLCDAARSFQTALFEADLPSAMSFVAPEDRPRLEQWSAPRQAALVASFGRAYEGRVTEVEVTQRGAESAVVRVRFRIQDREQQTFHHWKRADTGWVVILDAPAAE